MFWLLQAGVPHLEILARKLILQRWKGNFEISKPIKEKVLDAKFMEPQSILTLMTAQRRLNQKGSSEGTKWTRIL